MLIWLILLLILYAIRQSLRIDIVINNHNSRVLYTIFINNPFCLYVIHPARAHAPLLFLILLTGKFMLVKHNNIYHIVLQACAIEFKND